MPWSLRFYRLRKLAGWTQHDLCQELSRPGPGKLSLPSKSWISDPGTSLKTWAKWESKIPEESSWDSFVQAILIFYFVYPWVKSFILLTGIYQTPKMAASSLKPWARKCSYHIFPIASCTYYLTFKCMLEISIWESITKNTYSISIVDWNSMPSDQEM